MLKYLQATPQNSLELPTGRKEWIAKARQAEDLGYTAFLTSDHPAYTIDPAVTFMEVAETTSLCIVSYLFCNDFMSPVILAREVANLDLLSEGRFQFGSVRYVERLQSR